MNNETNDIYKDTIDISKEASVQKAVEIFMDQMNKNTPKIKRPDINPLKGVAKILASVLLMVGVFVLLNLYDVSLYFGMIPVIIIVVLNAKKTAIWMVLLYQKYAPDRLREACVFTPTCSTYMILAIEKYGLIKGVMKGINRLWRCRPPNGGVDNP